jgi:hypothetical protein
VDPEAETGEEGSVGVVEGDDLAFTSGSGIGTEDAADAI